MAATAGHARRLSGEGAPRAREVKVVLLGDTGVGKSSLVLRFVTNNFKPYSESTIGCVCASARVLMARGLDGRCGSRAEHVYTHTTQMAGPRS